MKQYRAKAVALLLVLLGLIGAAISGYYTLLAAYVGAYQGENGFFSSAAYYREIDAFIAEADRWYQLDAQGQKYRMGHGGAERLYQELTEKLQKTSLIAQREEKENDQVERIDIAGRTAGAEAEQLTFRSMGMISDPVMENGEAGETMDPGDTNTQSEPSGERTAPAEAEPVVRTYGYRIYFADRPDADDGFIQSKHLQEKLYQSRMSYPIALGLSLLIALAGFIYMLATSGRNADGELVLRGIHRVPLEVLTVLFGAVIGIIVLSETAWYGGRLDLIRMLMAVCAAWAAVSVALCMVWIHTIVARLKAHAFWRTTLTGMVCIRVWRGLCGGVNQITAAREQDAAGAPKKNGMGRRIARKISGAAEQLMLLVRSIRVTWKLCIITAAALGVTQLAAIVGVSMGAGVVILVLLWMNLVIVGAVGFFAMQLDRLKKGGIQLASGDLTYKIPMDTMYWDLRQHAQNLNEISNGMAVAVEEQLKSERMKYELLTNISHDIKTPLTSIINYVDLLKAAQAEGEHAAEYLEVLDRQAAKLKKLITDLIEVSKAATGNITVEAAQMQAGEMLRQCIGEYSERFSAQQLEVLLDIPEQEPSIYADGRLLWRVFDNLMGNIVKYAMPGTRVYIDLSTNEQQVEISLKNISRDRLNIAAAELMERFVRGDISRTTEGSGLGLSIARSLVELMDGRFALVVDGDLFKVMLTFAETKA